VSAELDISLRISPETSTIVGCFGHKGRVHVMNNLYGSEEGLTVSALHSTFPGLDTTHNAIVNYLDFLKGEGLVVEGADHRYKFTDLGKLAFDAMAELSGKIKLLRDGMKANRSA